MPLEKAPANETASQAATRMQRAAADPTVSAWVSANAGTGKTQVLTSRVLRLLLAGTPPERILALTYTKAAAAEMAKRVFDRLARWVTAPEADLNLLLADLLGRPAVPDELSRSRTLFAHAIETPGGLKVQTIHAFCERLLQRFPLEAGVPPQFTILDDATGAELIRVAIDDMLRVATAKPESRLGRALQTAIAYAADDGFDSVLRDALRRRSWLTAMSRLELDSDGGEKVYAKALGIDPTATPEKLATQRATLLSDSDLDHAIRVLGDGKATDQKLSAALSEARIAATPKERIAALTTALLTKEQDPRSDKAFITKAIRDKEPGLTTKLTTARDKFARLGDDQRQLELLAATMALARLADAVMQRYSDAKARKAALDFDDLISKTASLLTTDASGAAGWVLYKLDGGLDHILVDEAQDTSRPQWSVVEALATEFFAGGGARDIRRTLFAVGDEKQSIYGFQGAEPKMFAAMGGLFEASVERAKLQWRRVPLNVSFRTVAPILDAVDRIFADPVRTPGIGTDGESGAIRHVAHRAGQAGLVEIWPAEMPDDPAEVDAFSPLADPPTTSPIARLSGRIADTIAGWLQSGEVLASENRPVRASDIIVLVRRRNPFAPAMVAALKARQIAVAGADRLGLVEQIAVEDLMALGDFLTLPEDDLALACVLKSPLFDLDDDDLMKIAPRRRGMLWKELLDRAKTDARLTEAAAMLRLWRGEADYLPPYEFFSAILDRDGGQMRRRMLTRLGPEAAESLDEFMTLAIAYDEREAPSIAGFLADLRLSQPQIKRDMEQGRDEVRVMTVHGAKGLEAPIVFLPDTCSSRSGGQPGGLIAAPGLATPSTLPDLHLWPVKGTSKLAAVSEARSAIADGEAAERNRLLYVALTRARDRLYVAGYAGKQGPQPGCWYEQIAAGLQGSLTDATMPDGRTIRRLRREQRDPHERPKHDAAGITPALVRPDWATRRPPAEPQLAVPFAPSRLVALETDDAGDPLEPRPHPLNQPVAPAVSQLVDSRRFLRGTLTHALLQHLPALPARRWAGAASAYLATRAGDLSPAIRDSIAREALAILTEPQFTALFGPDSQAEVPVVAVLPRPSGKGPPLRLNGQIDRLVRTGNIVLIVDYKTNRPPPLALAGVADAYLYQLAAYRLAVQHLFDGCHVSAAIVWTDGARIMGIPDALLDTYQSRLWTLDPASLDVCPPQP